jgi:Tol biopolymer transport system component
VNREGKRLGTLGEPGRYGQVVLSPDDRRVAAEIADAEGRFDLWLIDVLRGVPSRLTTDAANERDPVWSPDSQSLVFSSDASGDQDLLRKDLSGSEPAAPLPGDIGRTRGERDIAKSWVREGNTLLYLTTGTERALWVVSLDGALQAVDVRTGAAGIEVGMPETLVAARDLRAVLEGPDYTDYGVSADGQRFLVKRPVDDASRQRIHVVVDWPSLLK